MIIVQLHNVLASFGVFLAIHVWGKTTEQILSETWSVEIYKHNFSTSIPFSSSYCADWCSLQSVTFRNGPVRMIIFC